METLISELCPKELDLRFLYPVKNGKKGDFEDADYILASICKIGKPEMDRAKDLKLIHVPATGYNHVDIAYAKEKGIPVCNSAGENASTTAEFTIALMLACMRRLSMIDRRCKQGEWHSWTWRHDSYELRGKTVGIVGGGAIGRMVMQRLQGWDCKLIYSDPYRMPEEMEKKLNCEYVSLETLLRESDVVSLHCPLTDATRAIINAKALARMKPGAILINTARGPLLDEAAVAEALHSKLLGRISDRIAERGSRIVLLAGPSSSGKTTTAKRLGIQLMTNMLTPKVISLDDYFVDRECTPRDADGELDYESLYALDLERLQTDLAALLRGEEVNLPTYSFELGRRVDKRKPMRLNPGEVLLIEGIHGLNPELTASLPQQELFKIYVSALTTLSIDDHNWIPTTDNRLLRRIVRDYKYRHTSALDTIRRWPSVRRGEEKWIFPYQENADATFNSSLIFELGVMRDFALPVLREVPHDAPEYAEAYRMIRFLEYFEPIPADQIPATSLLREFLGGSAFKY